MFSRKKVIVVLVKHVFFATRAIILAPTVISKTGPKPPLKKEHFVTSCKLQNFAFFEAFWAKNGKTIKNCYEVRKCSCFQGGFGAGFKISVALPVREIEAF